MSADAAQAQEPGLREQKKQERLQRIKKSARDLFIEKGYDDATLREIARRANLSAGTIFRYAEDKRDLLFLIFNDDHFGITDVAFADTGSDEALLDQLIGAFSHYYAYFAEQPMLARYVAREMMFYDTGEQARKIALGRENILAGLARIVDRARASGEIATPEDSAMVVQMIFDIYQAESRRWLHNDVPDFDDGIAALRRALNLLIQGLRV